MTFLEDADATDARLQIWMDWVDIYQQKLKLDIKRDSWGQQKISYYLVPPHLSDETTTVPALITKHSVLFVYPRGSKSRSSNAVLFKRSAHQGPQDRSFDPQSTILSTGSMKIVSFPTTVFSLYLTKWLKSLNFKRKSALLHILSIYGGETASTGIKKLELHTERPVSS